MKIGRYKITGGPNWQFYLVTGFFIYLSIQIWSLWPILGWLGFCVLLIPICFKLARWNEDEEKKRARERQEELESMKELFRRKPPANRGDTHDPGKGLR
jgi:hypothetical protein